MEFTLTLLKDLMTIVFYAVASTVTILTYLRAKAAVLQPKRTELVKKQTESYSSFLAFINENENSIDNGLD